MRRREVSPPPSAVPPRIFRLMPNPPTPQVRLREHGLDAIEVADNGAGVPPSSRPLLGRPHHTSKLSGVSDLDTLTTYGFRGEALASLASLADVVVTTRCADEEAGARLTLARGGGPPSVEPAARATGTTVAIRNLFASLPVRRRELERGARREAGKAAAVLQAYALAAPTVRIVATDQTGGGPRTTIVATTAGEGLTAAAGAVLGRAAAGLLAVDAEVGVGGGDDAAPPPPTIRLVGLVSDARRARPRGGGGGSSSASPSTDRQFFSVNGRPIDSPRLARALNEAWRSLGSPATAASRPAAVLDLRLPPGTYDVNVTPDKRTVLLHREAAIMAAVVATVSALWEPARSTYAVGGAGTGGKAGGVAAPVAPAKRRRSPDEASEDEEEDEEAAAPASSPPPAGRPRRAATRETGPLPDLASFALGGGGGGGASGAPVARPRRGAAAHADQPSLAGFVERRPKAAAKAPSPSPEASEESEHAMETDGDGGGSVAPCEPVERSPMPSAAVAERSPTPAAAEAASSPPPAAVEAAPSPPPAETSAAAPSPPPPTAVAQQSPALPPPPPAEPTCTLNVDLDALRAASAARVRAARAAAAAAAAAAATPAADYGAASLAGQPDGGQDTAGGVAAAAPAAEDAPPDAPTSALERVFSRAQFTDLAAGVIGQFNLGFIVARLGTDLFIVDQHASDEKATYERLAATTTLQHQPLLAPLPLDLAPHEAAAARDHADVLAANGFAVSDAPDGSGALVLTAVPYSKGHVFGAADVAELAARLAGGAASATSAGPPRPAAVRAMLAMRACRSSIMVGRPLDRGAASRVVCALASLDSPWNCPHGRPTMRHLAVLPASK